MGQLEELRPLERRRVFDLVREAGLDVSAWSNFSRGPKWAAANPKYCYEWAFVDPGRAVLLNLWHAHLHENQRTGIVTWFENLRSWVRRTITPVGRKRAEAFAGAIREAAHNGLPIRVVVLAGKMRTSWEASAKPSTVQRRILDPLPWSVTLYEANSGQCTLTRGVTPKGSVDQFDVPQDDDTVTERVSVQGTVFVRDPALRMAALLRANGRCEFCRNPGFTMADGRIFLETHHILPLSEGGRDSANNVAAVCANHHREAHHGSRATVIRDTLLKRVRRALDRKQSNKPFHPMSGPAPFGRSVRRR